MFPAPVAASLLAAIAAGSQSLTQVAAAHNVPFPQFTLWLLRPDIQQQLIDLSRGVAAAARLSATAALPDVVHALKATLAELSAPEPPQRPTLFGPQRDDQLGPNPGQIFRLRRQRALLSTSYLLLRIARLPDPATAANPPQRTHAAPCLATSPKGEVAAQRPVGAPAFPTESLPSKSSVPSLAHSAPRASHNNSSHSGPSLLLAAAGVAGPAP